MLRVIFLLFFLFILKTASSQQPVLEWVKAFTGANINNFTGSGNGRSVAVDQQGNVYSAGFFEYTVDFDPGPGIYNMLAVGRSNRGIYISKLSPTGDFIWAKQIPTFPGGGAPIEIKVDLDGNVLLVSNFDYPFDADPGPSTQILTPISQDAFAVKFDTNGDFIWAKQLAGSSSKKETFLILKE